MIICDREIFHNAFEMEETDCARPFTQMLCEVLTLSLFLASISWNCIHRISILHNWGTITQTVMCPFSSLFIIMILQNSLLKRKSLSKSVPLSSGDTMAHNCARRGPLFRFQTGSEQASVELRARLRTGTASTGLNGLNDPIKSVCHLIHLLPLSLSSKLSHQADGPLWFVQSLCLLRVQRLFTGTNQKVNEKRSTIGPGRDLYAGSKVTIIIIVCVCVCVFNLAILSKYTQGHNRESEYAGASFLTVTKPQSLPA